jgi:hypothetical protein
MFQPILPALDFAAQSLDSGWQNALDAVKAASIPPEHYAPLITSPLILYPAYPIYSP